MSLPGKGPANLATSSCQRTLHGNALSEVIKLDGDEEGLSEGESEKFIATFPFRAAIHRAAGNTGTATGPSGTGGTGTGGSNAGGGNTGGVGNTGGNNGGNNNGGNNGDN